MRLEIDVLRWKYPFFEDTQSSNVHMIRGTDWNQHSYEKSRDLLARSAAVSRSTCGSEFPFCGHIDSEIPGNLVSPLTRDGECESPSILTSSNRCGRLGEYHSVAFPPDQIRIPPQDEPRGRVLLLDHVPGDITAVHVHCPSLELGEPFVE